MDDRTILVHHGIKGQKWGERNGPPYPLGTNQKSMREKRLAKVHKTRKQTDESNETRLTKTEESSNKRRFQLSDKQKRALKIGAAALGAALLVYGGYRLIKSDQLDPNVFLDSQLKRKVVEAADFETQINDDLKKINRGGSLGHHLLRGRQVNCTSCSMAYEMRRRGYDVIAGTTREGRTNLQVKSFFKNGEFETLMDNPWGFKRPVSSETLSDVTKTLLAQGEGARGIINGQYVMGGGHSIAYEVHNGRVHFVDGQIGRQYKDVSEALGQMYVARYMRTDTLALSNRAAETVRNNTAVSLLRELPSGDLLRELPSGDALTLAAELATTVGYIVALSNDQKKHPERYEGYEESSDAKENDTRRR